MLEVLRPFAWDSLRWAGGFVFGFWAGINLSKSREGLATREVLSIESKITFFFAAGQMYSSMIWGTLCVKNSTHNGVVFEVGYFAPDTDF